MQTGRIILADEIHTPDSSRYWIDDSYERRFAAGRSRPRRSTRIFVRRWVTARCDPYRDPIPEIPNEIILETARIYIDAYEIITGKTFELPLPGVSRYWRAFAPIWRNIFERSPRRRVERRYADSGAPAILS